MIMEKIGKLKQFVNLLVENEEDDRYYRISPDEYKQLLKLSDYSPGVTKIKKFGGKPLYITGDLNVSYAPLTSLGNVGYIDGYLDISNTKISKLPDNIIIKRHTWDFGSPLHTIRVNKEEQRKLAENQEKKENGEWEINYDDEANCAQAVYQELIQSREIEEMTDEIKDQLNELERKIIRLEKEYDETTDDDTIDELSDMIDETQLEIDDLKEDKYDIYETLVYAGKYQYGLRVFEVIPMRSGNDYPQYAVGNSDEIDQALVEYYTSYVDEVGLDGIKDWLIENCIDTDDVVSVAEDDYYYDITNNPEVYFKDSDFELTDEQEKRQSDLENYISELEDYISELNDKQNRLDDEIDEPEEFSKAWDEIQDLISDAEEKKDEAQDELDSIEPDTEPTEDMIQSKVDDLVYDVKRDPVYYLKDRGLEIKEYVDKDCIIEELVRNGSVSDLNGYDGNYDTYDIGGELYYVMRIN
jgi:uncharacterized coiled-coil protein SlyX